LHFTLGYPPLVNIPWVPEYPAHGASEEKEITAENLMDLRHAVEWFLRAQIYMERYAAAVRTLWFEGSRDWDDTISTDVSSSLSVTNYYPGYFRTRKYQLMT
jgi:hypothetical protein